MYASTGIISATAFHGDGSNLENTGATLTAAAGTQRLVVTSLTSGTMVDAATDGDLTFNATTNTLNTDNLIVAGNLTVSGDQTILNTTQLEVEDINIGIASANPKLNNAQLDGAGITIHGLNGDKTLTWDNSNSRLGFNTDLYSPNFFVGDITASGDVDIDGHTELDQLRVSGVSTFQGNVNLGDNDKLIFGDDDDLEIFIVEQVLVMATPLFKKPLVVISLLRDQIYFFKVQAVFVSKGAERCSNTILTTIQEI